MPINVLKGHPGPEEEPEPEPSLPSFWDVVEDIIESLPPDEQDIFLAELNQSQMPDAMRMKYDGKDDEGEIL